MSRDSSRLMVSTAVTGQYHSASDSRGGTRKPVRVGCDSGATMAAAGRAGRVQMAPATAREHD